MLAARKTNVITARARKIKRSARTLANARKDHSGYPYCLCSSVVTNGHHAFEHAEYIKKARVHNVQQYSCFNSFVLEKLQPHA